MARNETYIDASPRDVFDVLADARTYAEWVVGSHEIRAADRGWPAPGTVFDHTVGRPPVRIKDETAVVAATPPVMLELRARARPLPAARVTLHLQPERDGTRVTMIEDPASRLLALLAVPLGHWSIHLRNRESLRRLKAIAEGRAARPAGELAERSSVS